MSAGASAVNAPVKRTHARARTNQPTGGLRAASSSTETDVTNPVTAQSTEEEEKEEGKEGGRISSLNNLTVINCWLCNPITKWFINNTHCD